MRATKVVSPVKKSWALLLDKLTLLEWTIAKGSITHFPVPEQAEQVRITKDSVLATGQTANVNCVPKAKCPSKCWKVEGNDLLLPLP